MNDRLAVLLEWTRFAARAWHGADAAPPVSGLPARELRQLGLAPLVFDQLRRRRDARAIELGDHHRNVASTNLVLFAQGARARDALTGQGIVPVLIKGGAFLLRHSPADVGARSLADLDLLVGPERFDEALAVLGAAGWRHASPELRYSSRVAPAVTLVSESPGGAATQLDLHRHLAQWPHLRGLPARVMAGAEPLAGWSVCSAQHAVLIVALHRARHAFANDARDLFDLRAYVASLDDAAWSSVVGQARTVRLSGALYAVLSQCAWWFGCGDDRVSQRAAGLRASIGPLRRGLLERMALPAFALTQRSPWSGPLGRNFGVFPAALHAPLASLSAAALFLPRRLAETIRGRA